MGGAWRFSGSTHRTTALPERQLDEGPIVFATRAILAWLAVLVLAVLNGALRQLMLLPAFGKPFGYVLSGLLLCAFVVLVAVALGRWMFISSARRALAAGALWLGLTLIFEFGVGIVQGLSWPEMLAPYTFKDGNIWPVVLAVVFVAPYVGWRCRGAS